MISPSEEYSGLFWTESDQKPIESPGVCAWKGVSPWGQSHVLKSKER